jgi:glyoxylase-like metal-dependent hydrolase (beta-lactamase superfamily II)
VFFLTCGALRVPTRLMRPRGGKRRGLASHDIPLTVAVIRRADGRVVLVDAALARAEMDAPVKHLGGLNGPLMRLRPTGGGDPAAIRPRAIADQLAWFGIEPGEVVAIVATHLHVDHVGGFADFPNAEIVTVDAEIEAAARGGAARGFVHTEQLRRSGRLRPVRLEPPGRHGFPAHLDLFGDGRVLLLDARGHTAGSVAVHLTDPTDPRPGGAAALMAGDAAYHHLEYRTGRKSGLARLVTFRDDWLRATWGHLLAFERAHPDIPVVLSHDMETFEALPHRPGG